MAWEQLQTWQAIMTAVLVAFLGWIFMRTFGGKKSVKKEGKAAYVVPEGILKLAIQEKRKAVYLAAPDIKKEESKKYPKTAAERMLILGALSNNFVFSHMVEESLANIVLHLEPLEVFAQTDVVVEGDSADYFYIIKDGNFSVLVQSKHVGTLRTGNSFGETGLLYDNLRNATIRADGDATVWRLDRDTFRQQLAKMHVAQSSGTANSLKSARILKGLSDEKVEELSNVAVRIEHKSGQVIMSKGEKGDLGYFIMDGEVLVTDLPDGIPDYTLGFGEHFGIHGLFSDEVRSATVVADTDCIVSAVSAEDVGGLLADIKELTIRDHELRKLKSIPLFSEFSIEMLDVLLSATQTKTFKNGETIIKQGDVGTTFYLIHSGSCAVVLVDDDGNRTDVKQLTDLGYFGEMALLTDSPRNADVVARSDCTLYEVKQATFKRIFGSSANFSRQLNEIVKGRGKALLLSKNPPEKIKREELKVVKLLGMGTFGIVHLVEDQNNKLQYALKAMSIKFIEEHKQELNIVGEKVAMFTCDHPFILNMYASFRDKHNILLLLEYCSGGEMFNVIHNDERNCLPEPEAKFYSACMILGMEHLALLSMAYRDMKPENTLVDQDGYCKLIDLGFAKVIKGRTFTFCGTPEYMAPEIIVGSGHNRGVDYFALGVFIYEMIAGQTPFFDFNTDTIMRKIVKGKYRFGPKFEDPLKSFIEKLMNPDPSKRLGMLKGGVADLISDPWFKDIDFDELSQKKIEAPWIPPEDKPPSDDEDVPTEGHPPDEDYVVKNNAEWLEHF